MTNTKCHPENDNMWRINIHRDLKFFFPEPNNLENKHWHVFLEFSTLQIWTLLLSPYLLPNFQLHRVRNVFLCFFPFGTENLCYRNPWDNDFSEIELSSIFKKVFSLKLGLRSQAGQDSKDSAVACHSGVVLCC